MFVSANNTNNLPVIDCVAVEFIFSCNKDSVLLDIFNVVVYDTCGTVNSSFSRCLCMQITECSS